MITDNLIAGAEQGAVVGMRWAETACNTSAGTDQAAFCNTAAGWETACGRAATMMRTACCAGTTVGSISWRGMDRG